MSCQCDTKVLLKLVQHHQSVLLWCLFFMVLGPVVQSVGSQIADPGIASSILARSHTLVEIDYEIIFSPYFADSIRVVFS